MTSPPRSAFRVSWLVRVLRKAHLEPHNVLLAGLFPTPPLFLCEMPTATVIRVTMTLLMQTSSDRLELIGRAETFVRLVPTDQMLDVVVVQIQPFGLFRQPLLMLPHSPASPAYMAHSPLQRLFPRHNRVQPIPASV